MKMFHPNASSGIKHIGIIPDGGRRWAKANNLTLLNSYNETRKKIAEFVIILAQLGIPEISLFLSSRENFKRHQQEVEAFNSATSVAILETIPQMALRHKIRVNVAGDISHLHKDFIKSIDQLVELTRHFERVKLNLLISYNPADEINHAIKNTDSGEFINKLWVNTPLDLIIRTGGANLLSNFLPLQAGYARLYFCEKLFNDLTLNDLLQYTIEYSALERKYGE